MPSLPIDDENLPLFTVGQVARMLEIQQAFLRRLDEFNVVEPSRSSGGQRRYTRNEITVVQYVVRLADDGMTLAAIRRVLELEARVQELEAERDQLRAALLGSRPQPGQFDDESVPGGPRESRGGTDSAAGGPRRQPAECPADSAPAHRVARRLSPGRCRPASRWRWAKVGCGGA